MSVLVHLLVVTLATLFGWDVIRRLIPVKLPGSVARIAAAALAILLWWTGGPLVLFGMATAGGLMLLNYIVETEPVYPWWRHLKREEKPKSMTAKQMFEEVMKNPAASIGTKAKADVGTVGDRIPDL